MTIENQNCEYVKVSSTILEDIAANPSDYVKIEIESTINCCTELFTADLNFELYNDATCTTCNNTYVWTIDLQDIANADLDITGIYVKNLLTGEVTNILSAPIDFAAYLTACPANSCTISTVGSYATTFNTEFDTWFTNNVAWTTAKATMCDNTLQVCDLAPNYIPLHVEYTDGTTVNTMSFSFFNDPSTFLLSEALYIAPSFYGLDKLIDGVYKVKIRATKANGSWAEEENCAFIDCETKCKVADYIAAFLSLNVEEKDEALYVTMAHYALVNASNCGCNCAELCNLYFQLYETLASRTPITNQNVCSTC